MLRGLFACISRVAKSDKSSLGLWTWDDVETPSSQKGPGRQGQPHLQKPNRMIMVFTWM